LEASPSPGQNELAIDLAERYIARGKAEADPRYYGYAEGMLKSWRQTELFSPLMVLSFSVASSFK
jgi:hypothetical protein